jgi:hypothetical protein
MTFVRVVPDWTLVWDISLKYIETPVLQRASLITLLIAVSHNQLLVFISVDVEWTSLSLVYWNTLICIIVLLKRSHLSKSIII